MVAAQRQVANGTVTGTPTTADKREALRAADQAIRPLLAAINLDDLGTHNAGYWDYGGTDAWFAERERFVRALDLIVATTPSGSVIDLGCFVPYLPVALARLGYETRIVERFELYGSTFRSELEKVGSNEGIEVIDADLSSDDLVHLGEHDVVLLTAVVEHLNGSPRALMRRIHALTRPTGSLIFEVPNIATLAQRLRFLLGRSPLPDYKVYLESDYPFTGHNREMTVEEVRLLLDDSGFVIERLACYNYIPARTLSKKRRLLRAATAALPGNFGESIIVLGRPMPDP
jgi:2-polyprenyl-3-methyl-5-hydroxy-6-metoxy-1,4-benzoquinol methylase